VVGDYLDVKDGSELCHRGVIGKRSPPRHGPATPLSTRRGKEGEARRSDRVLERGHLGGSRPEHGRRDCIERIPNQTWHNNSKQKKVREKRLVKQSVEV